MPIASSPRDTDLPGTPHHHNPDHTTHPSTHPSTYLSTIADLDLPATPPASDISSGIDIQEPVKLIGEEEEEEEEEDEQEREGEGGSDCGCHRESLSRDTDNAALFPLTDLDLAEIENH